jgi:nucleoid-associated protein YgaU
MAGLIFMMTNPATMPYRLSLGSAKREARANGFGLYPEASDSMKVELINPNSPYSVIATLSNSLSRSFQDVPSGVGSGTVEIMNTDPQLALLNEELALRFRIKGRLASQMLVEVLARATRAQGEEAAQSTIVSGRSIVSILEEAVTYPGRGPATLPIEDTRIFNFANEDFNDSGWGPSQVIGFQNSIFSREGLPARWPASSAAWLWAPGSDHLYAPPGTVYFRSHFIVPAGVSEITIFLAIDDEGELWLDGQQVLEMTGWTEYRSVTIPVTPGLHTLAAKCRNDPQYDATVVLGGGSSGDLQYTVVSGDTLWAIAGRYYGDPTRWPTIYSANQAQIDADAASAGLPYTGRHAGHWIFPGQVFTIPGVADPNAGPVVTAIVNPAGLICAIYEATKEGLGQLLTTSNGSWKCLGYPVNEPGMTPGEVMGILLREAKNRGCFPSLSWTFNNSVDSAGRPWRRVGDISVRVGDDYLTVITQLAETYVDFAMRPAGLILDCYDIDAPQGAAVTSYTEEYDVTSLTNTRSA